MTILQQTFSNKVVLITGHTGFKGSWLTAWLISLGAKVVGISLDIPTSSSHFKEANLENNITDIRLDIRDSSKIKKVIIDSQADYVFHLAAQALVRPSYELPLETFSINAIGTANVSKK